VVYPKEISQKLSGLRHARIGKNPNAVATAANFVCGTFVRFFLSIDVRDRSVIEASFSSNGCGFTLAAAEVLAKTVEGKALNELHGLALDELTNAIQKTIGDVPPDRDECIASVIEALRGAFADFRARQIEEFQGEKALICTCFGIAEETIDALIATEAVDSIEKVAVLCNAGSGCGSCRMLIQEMLDSHLSR